MGIIEIFLLGIGLAMDAFAVSICKGLSVGRLRISHVMLAGVYFGGFQAIMPLIGYMLGSRFQSLIASFDHWIAFGLLALIGANMIREAFFEEEGKEGDPFSKENASFSEENASFSFGTMIPLAVATSIDALAVGITFSFLQVNIFLAVVLIGIITFAISSAGVKIGNVFGLRYKKKAEIGGGVILILLGIKILFEHLGIISF